LKSLAIIGTGGSVVQANFSETEIWGVNGAYTIVNVMPLALRPLFRMDKLFICDNVFSNETGTLNFDIGHINEFADRMNCQIFTLKRLKLGRHHLNAKPIPYKQMCKFFGDVYYTDSVCYMLAYALYSHCQLAESPNGVIRPELKEPLALHLYGIDMVTKREYQQSKGGLEFWLGKARALGCEVTISKGSAIMAHPLGIPYGWEHKIKYDMKMIDPFGLMKGKHMSTKQMEEVIAKQMGRGDIQGVRL
jgi:hypothetical protein